MATNHMSARNLAEYDALRNLAEYDALQRQEAEAIAALRYVAAGADKAPDSDTSTAKKMDVGKPPLWKGCLAYFPRALMAVAMVSEYGYRKYGIWDGWRLVPNGLERYMDADARHFLKLAIEGNYDAESGLAHLAQKAWNAMAELERAIQEHGLEVRRGNDIVDGVPVPNTAKPITL